MRLFLRKLTAPVLILIVLTPLVTTVAFGSEVRQFSVDPSSAVVWSANLNQGDQFSGSLSISGGSGNDINFWVTDPTGSVVLNQGRVSQGTSFAFTAALSGGYTLHFDNSFSLFSGKLVTLTYNMTSSVVTILTIAVVGAIVAGLVAGLFYLAVRKKKESVGKRGAQTSSIVSPSTQ